MTLQTLDKGSTALLVMDYQQFLVDAFVDEPATTLERVAGVLRESRAAGIPIIYVTVGFRPGHPEVSNNNLIFTGVRAGKRFVLGDDGTEIPGAIAPQPDDPVVVKHRVSAFESTDLAMLLRARRIDTLVMFGIATTGVVLSTVRQGADLDYRLVVLADLCHDTDAEAHRLLLEHVLPRQALVVPADEYLAWL